MTALRPLIQELPDCRDKSLGGGKAVNLGILIRAGFPVPGGFVITTEAFRSNNGSDLHDPANPIGRAVAEHWRALGATSVAVRSSATAEDMADASMAGQYDTFLDITTEDALLDAVKRCWASISSPRTRTYLAERGIDINRVAMAVVVQKLVPADVAGVMFTADPNSGSRAQMLVEASWGLGEAVVSGLVQPDVLRIERSNGRVISADIADKQVWICPGHGKGNGKGHSHDPLPVVESRRKAACLRSADVLQLWKLGVKAAEHFGAEQDLEWAIASGELYLLQSRPITTLAQAETYESLLQNTRSHLRALIETGHGPWVLHNISETLKHPTPLTWSVVKRFMSGDGGFGAMYRQMGFEPSRKVCTDGFLIRIAGRAYMDVSMASEMFFEDFPFKYDLSVLRSNPDASQSPPTIPTGTLRDRMNVAKKIAEANRKAKELAKDFDQRLSQTILPEFAEYCRQEKKRELSKLTAYELIDVWRQREHKVMDEFAAQSLIPSMLAGMAMGELRQTLDENLWDEDPDALAAMLSSGHAPDKTLEANAQLYEVATGKRPAETWLADYGHRAPDEFDLSTPRWRERPDELLAMAKRLETGQDPMSLHHHNRQRTEQKLKEVRARLPARDAAELDQRIALAHRYLPFRETGKYYLMMGYDLLRDVAMESGRRLEIGEDIFQLTLEEMLDALRVGYAPIHLIQERQRLYDAERRVQLPSVIDVEALPTLGEPLRVHAAGSHKAFAVSTGIATGPARIVYSPEKAGDLGSGYILVCPSTDPGWTPLFVNAAGLILECGGTLSHGAVVAREMNIPAVVLQGATSIFLDGESITVDGRSGIISRPGEDTKKAALIDYRPGASAQPTDTSDPLDTKIPRPLLPPPAGRRERASNRLRNVAAVGWGLFLLAFWLLPQRILHDRAFAVMDTIFWPLVRNLGKPGAVAVISAAVAIIVMLTQRFLTDNGRLLEAKKRAAYLDKLALTLPKGSPRRGAMLDVGGPVQMRVVGASFVPLAVLLGPLILSFLWFPQRVDPAAWNPLPGASVAVKVSVDARYTDPVTLTIPAPLQLAAASEPTQSIKPINQTLDDTLRSLRRYKATQKSPKEPGEILMAALLDEKIRDLEDYLKAGVPPQELAWNLKTNDVPHGRYIVQAISARHAISIPIVIGDAFPPGDTLVSTNDSQLLSISLTASQAREPTFFAPLGFMQRFIGKARMTYWDIGWLGVYLLAYLPAMFGARWLLKVA